MGKTIVVFKDYTTKQKLLEYGIILFVSASFLLLFSLWTSPLYKDWYGCDASFFTLAGRAITSGKVMYRDFYDLKGPYFFLIQAIGQFIAKGRLGAFILQLVALFLAAVLIWDVSLHFISKAKASFILIVFYFCHIATLWGGNTLEEFALPISLLCMYLSCRWYLNARNTEDYTIPNYIPLILGASFGIFALSKISVSGVVLGITATFMFFLITNKSGSKFFFFLLYWILGISLAALPVIIYFAYNNCLLDMINCVFIVGFRRSADYAELFNLTWELKCSGVTFAFIFSVTHRKRIAPFLGTMLMATSAATYLFLHLGTPFYYYFTSVYPCLILALALFLMLYNPLFVFENYKQGLCLLLFAIFLFYYIPISVETIHTAMYERRSTSYDDYKKGSKDLAAFIPEFQRNSVFSFLIDMQWYEINDIIPCNRYIVNVPFFIELDENALGEIEDFLNNTPPHWIVCGECLDLNIPEAYDIIESKYTEIYSNDVGHLYLLDE